jgi:hypothetical protein
MDEDRGGRPIATAVVIPAGPRDDVADTLDSVLCYIKQPRLVVIVNDAASAQVDALVEVDPDVRVILPPPNLPSGTRGGLWLKLARAYRVVLEVGEWDAVIRMDADALVIAPGLEVAAARRFHQDATLGVLGAYRLGPDGGERDWTPAARRVRAEIGVRGLRHPVLRAKLRSLVERATQSGYVLGSHALGTCVLAPRLLMAWAEHGWLELDVLGKSLISDDHLVGLLAAAAGFRTEEMSGPSDLMAVQWKGLPASPHDLLSRGKALVHSVRSYADLNEHQIRAFFREHRARRV